MKTQHYLISPVFARANSLPSSFVATVLRETDRAVFVHGYGETDPTGTCCVCGKTLTHPGSILLGIGPECLGNWGARDIKLDNITEEQKLRLKELIQSKKVDQWIPRSIIKKTMATEILIQAPSDHRILVGSKGDNTPGNKKAREWKNEIAIYFPYSQDTVNKVKTLEGRRWHSEGKYWTCPIHVDAIRDLKEWGFELDSVLTQILEKSQVSVEDVKVDLSNLVFDLKKTLLPFQVDGVKFLEAKGGRALIGDDMGLGKTIQALAYLQLHPEQRPAIIVCPASLKLNWKKEIESTMTDIGEVTILQERRLTTLVPHNQIIIINYDILPSWVEELKRIKPQVVIADECHYFKSNAANRTKAMKLLVKGVPHFIALSGTPIVNRPIEIYNAISMINPAVVPSFWKYAKRYCGAKHNGFGWDFTGASNTEELHDILTKTVMIRRKKADVLKDLPDKVYSFLPFELDNEKEYNSIEQDFIGYVRKVRGNEAAEKASNAEMIAQIEYLKQAAVRGKLNAVVEWINDFLESGEKLVVFGVHKFVIDRLMQEFGPIAVKIDGSTPMEARNQAVQSFQTDSKVRLFVGNIKAAGVGLTLTAASNVAFVELPWTPADLVQAEDRCHRIGQKDAVNVYLLLSEGTIESEIAALLDSKRKVLDAVLDGKITEEESLLESIINLVTKK